MSKEDLDAPPMLLTTGDSGRLQEVTQLDLAEPFKTLGIHKMVSGCQKEHITEMKRKSDAYVRGILSVSVNHFEAWTGLFTIWLGQMNYPLSATSLSEAQCKHIKSRAVNASLTKCGFNRKVSRAIVFGSPWFGGAWAGDTCISNREFNTCSSSSNIFGLPALSTAS